MLARSADELVLFNRLDREMEWPDEQGMHPFTNLLFKGLAMHSYPNPSRQGQYAVKEHALY